MTKEIKGTHYVYECYVDGELKYIGMGKGGRYKHCTSGTSSCSELNRDFHEGRQMEVKIVHKGLTEMKAKEIEASLIRDNFDSLYNKVIMWNEISRPNVSRMKAVRILCSNWSTGKDGELFSSQMLSLRGIDTGSDGYLEMISFLIQSGLSIYIVETDTKTKMVVIDKTDDITVDSFVNNVFSHLSHPEGLYTGSTGLWLEYDRY